MNKHTHRLILSRRVWGGSQSHASLFSRLSLSGCNAVLLFWSHRQKRAVCFTGVKIHTTVPKCPSSISLANTLKHTGPYSQLLLLWFQQKRVWESPEINYTECAATIPTFSTTRMTAFPIFRLYNIKIKDILFGERNIFLLRQRKYIENNVPDTCSHRQAE